VWRTENTSHGGMRSDRRSPNADADWSDQGRLSVSGRRHSACVPEERVENAYLDSAGEDVDRRLTSHSSKR
jgi:hypothetical protein